MNSAPVNSINLALGELSFGFPDILREQAISLIERGIPRYTPNAGLPELREAIASYYDGAVSSEQVCVCNGAEEALYVLLTALINPSDAIAIPDPDYSAYTSIVSIMGGTVVRLPYENDLKSIDWDKWDSLLSKNIKLLLLSNPQNPGGMFFDPEQMKCLLELCRKYEIIVAVDEIYRELYYISEPQTFCSSYESLFIISGLSKSHLMSGWRLGWIVSPSDFTPSIIKTRQYVSTCSNWLSQKLGVFALSSSGRLILEDVRKELYQTRSFTASALQRVLSPDRLLVPDATPYIMFRCDTDDLSFAKNMAEKGVITVPGSAFGDVSKTWIRINHAIEMTSLKKALDIICSFLEYDN